jgi:integrase
MTGSIVTRTLANGSLRYDAVWRANGAQKWKTFNKRRAAERFLASVVKASHEGVYEDVVPTPMGEVFDRWLTHSLDVRVQQRRLKPSTAKSYRCMVEQHLRPAFKDVRSDRLRRTVIEDWEAARAKEIEAGTLSPKYYNNVLNLLSVIVKWARGRSFLAHDPLFGVKRARRDDIERVYLEPSQIPELLSAADDVRDSTILYLAAYSGMRRGELFGLKWIDVDWQHGQVRVSRSLYQGALTTPKTKNSVRTIDLPPSVLAALAIYRAFYPSIADGFVFRTPDGAALDPDNWSKRQFAAIAKRAAAEGLPTIGLHGLRHTYASLLINQGESLKYTSRQLGHGSVMITADLYGHLFRETSSAAMTRLDARIESIGARGKVVQMPARTGTRG